MYVCMYVINVCMYVCSVCMYVYVRVVCVYTYMSNCNEMQEATKKQHQGTGNA